ncbi:MAG: FAD-dependent oxidoreductase [Clostridia bacterium]|nr:FAD-dependent oxidoreductase [Clostridia bacterium]
MNYESLFSPMKIGNVTIKNRIVMTPAEMNLNRPDGTPTERSIAYHERRARGGAGLIIPGICRVNDWNALTSFGQLSMSHDYHIEPMKKLVEAVHKHDAKIAIQLHHAGRQVNGIVYNFLPFVLPIEKVFPNFMQKMFKMMTPILESSLIDLNTFSIFSVYAPSKVEKSAHVSPPNRAMTKREIKKVIQDFINAAVRCQKAGIDIVQIHAAHGYLINQFLSPNTNHRTDEYGGSFENRLRFLDEIILGIREKCGKDYPIMVRLTVDEMYEKIGKPGKGYTIEEGKKIAKHLEELGVDALDITSAGYDTYNYWLEPTSFEVGWRDYLTAEIKSVVKTIPVGGAAFIRSPKQANELIETGNRDFVGSARNFFSDPDWANKAYEGREDEIIRCIGCLHCMSSCIDHAAVHFGKGLAGECALNPALGHEISDENIKRDAAGKKAIVIGAGPSGLMAAKVMARRGFEVTIFEKESKAGGQVMIASTPHLRKKLYWAIEDLENSVKKLGVTINYNTEISAEEIKKMNPYAVIISTGGTPIVPKSIPGIDLPIVKTSTDIIMGDEKPENKNIAVIGSGMTGLETAEELVEQNNKVTIVEMAKEIAPGTWFQLREDSLSRIEKGDVRFMPNYKLLEIKKDAIVVESVKDSNKETIDVDMVVLAMGVRSINKLYEELKDSDIQIAISGDAQKSGTIAHAIHGGYNAALEIK